MHLPFLAVALTREHPLTVSLKAQTGAGFLWQISKPLDGVQAEFSWSPLQEGEQLLIGALVEQTLTLKALRSTEGVLVIEHKRPWLESDPHSQVLRIEVTAL